MTTDLFTTQHVHVATATITVKSISVNNKQMTLSMFRQLIDEAIDDWDGMWGTVNYHPGNDCYVYGPASGPHYHVVWQKGDELRQDTVYLLELKRLEGDEAALRDWERIAALPQLFIAV